MKKRFTILIAAVMLLSIISLPWKAVGQKSDIETTYTFTSKSWAATPANWSGTKDGNQFNATATPKGVQVCTGQSGVVVTATKSFSKVKQVIVTYSSSKNGVGSIEVKVGNTSLGSQYISKSQTEKQLTYSASNIDGIVSFTCTCTANSMGINSIKIVEAAVSSTFSVTYNANDGSANPSTFTDNNGGKGYAAGATVDVLDNNPNNNNTPSFTKTGFSFSNWNTAPDGSGTPYDSETNNEIEISGNVTLYAIWAKNEYNVALSSIDNVTLSATYGTNSSIVAGGNADIDYDTEITLSATGLAPGKAFVWDVYKKDDTSTKVPVTNNKFNVPAYDVIILGEIVDMTYNNTYTSNVTVGSDKVVISNVEYDAYKAGTSNAAGSWTVTVPINTTKLHLHLACWGTESVTLSVSPTDYSSSISLTPNSGISGNSPFTWGSGNDDKDPSSTNHYKVITFADPLEEAVTLTFSASSGKRFVVWGVNAEASTNPYITADDVEIDDDATSGSITYMVHNVPEPEGTLTAAIKTGDWLTLGDIEENVPFTCEANPNAVERTATVTLTYSYGDDETTSLDVTVTQAPKVVTYTYTKATCIESGRHYILVGFNNDTPYAMGAQNGSVRDAIVITDDGNDVVSFTSDMGVREIVINGPEIITKDANPIEVYTFYDATAHGYVYASSSSSNNIGTRSYNTNADSQWKIVFDEENSNFVVTAQGTNSRNILKYNYNSGNPRFSCYGSNTTLETLLYLYVKNEVTPQYDFYKDITAASNWSTESNGWYFIASPLASAYTLSGSNLVAGTYDLYRLNNTTWENYKNDEHSDFTTLNNGTGYLYANSANVTLHFSGAINTFTTEENANQKVYSEGWNLIGNPYNIPVYINKPYYTLNAARNAVVATAVKNVAIAPCTGVIADGGTIIFTEASQNVQAINNGNIQMVLAHNVNVRGDKRVETIDNAIVSFNDGSQLEKFYFGNPSASIFIPQNGEDYAIAFSDRQGDVPLYFKANETGTYTISFAGDEMSLNGIYLIDILAEEEIDLSVNPSYTFIGSPADRMARFKIVFRNTGGDGTSDIFAYQNGNDIVVSGEGELQIFDVMGRMVSRQRVNGVETVNAMPYGVYIFKLNGMTQKIVVR